MTKTKPLTPTQEGALIRAEYSSVGDRYYLAIGTKCRKQTADSLVAKGLAEWTTFKTKAWLTDAGEKARQSLVDAETAGTPA